MYKFYVAKICNFEPIDGIGVGQGVCDNLYNNGLPDPVAIPD